MLKVSQIMSFVQYSISVKINTIALMKTCDFLKRYSLGSVVWVGSLARYYDS